jgi:hypothetical protein
MAGADPDDDGLGIRATRAAEYQSGRNSKKHSGSCRYA